MSTAKENCIRLSHLKYLHFELHFMLGCGINEAVLCGNGPKLPIKWVCLHGFAFTQTLPTIQPSISGDGISLSLSLWITFSKAKNLNYLNNITGVKNWGISWQMIIKIFILHTLSNKWFQHQIFSIFSSVQVLGYLFILAGNCIAPAVFL